jgi:hypothetical protein
MEKFFHLSNCTNTAAGGVRPGRRQVFKQLLTSIYPRSARAVRSRVVLRSLSDMPLADERELRVALVSVEVL